METKEYISNCIGRIMAADIPLKSHRQREKDVAEAVVIAANSGLIAAHVYLAQLCVDTDAGKYR